MRNSLKFTPTEKFPKMVTVTRGELRGKKFVNQEMANQAILQIEQKRVLRRMKKSINHDIQTINIQNLYYAN